VPGLKKNQLSVKHFLRFLYALVMFTTVCCSSDEVRKTDPGMDFYPLQKGRYQVYDVSQIKYTLSVPETLAYELKIQVVDSFAIQQGYTYVVYRYKRTTPGTDWTYLDTWSSTVDDRQAVQSEANTSYLKLKFPLKEGSTWNGNLYNNGAAEDYLLQDVGQSQTFNQKIFDNCVTVTQSDNQDFIVFLDERKETYAQNVGLVYKETTQLHYCTDTNEGCLGQQIVNEGIIYKQTIKTYGLE
jgi:hypothetical protein